MKSDSSKHTQIEYLNNIFDLGIMNSGFRLDIYREYLWLSNNEMQIADVKAREVQ